MELMKTDKLSKFTLITMFVIMIGFILFSGAPAYSISKVAAVSMLILLIISFLSGQYNNLPKTVITPIVISVTAYIIIYTVSLFYATTGQFALAVYAYYLGGASVFLLTVLLVNRNAVNARLLLFILSSTIGVAGIISMDAASLRLLTPAIESILSTLFHYESISLGGFETGTRMTSIIDNPNVFGSLAALGTLAASYLFLSSNSRRERNLSSGLLMVNAVSLLYCFSLGSLIGMFFAIVGMVAFAGEERPRIVFIILTTIIAAFISTSIGFWGMGRTGVIAALPLLSLFAIGIAFSFVLLLIDKFTEKVMSFGRKKITILLAAFLLLALSFLIAAVNLSDTFTFHDANTRLKRSAVLNPGEYKLDVTFGAESVSSKVMIESQSYDQASTHTSTILYDGPVSPALSFEVPLDSNVIFINISADQGATIEDIALLDPAGAIVKNINPDYLLLPTFMANRLQGIAVNENAAQRLVFFKDGFKIAGTSPIIGHGPGAFESKILSVQDYYYTTRGAHNHYIQTLDEVGIIGLAAFLSIFLFSIIAMLKKVRSANNRALYSVLFAMLIMIFIHTALEVTFIYGIYNMAAFMIFALISCQYGQKEVLTKKGKNIVLVPAIARHVTLGLCVAILCINLGQFAGMKMVAKASSSGDLVEFMDALPKGAVLDFTNDISYKTSYIAAFVPGLPESYLNRSLKYAEDLKRHNSFGALTELVNYYLKIGMNEKAYQTLNDRQSLLKYDANAWNDTFDFYRTTATELSAANDVEGTKVVMKYAKDAYSQLNEYLANSPLEIRLSEDNSRFTENL